MKKILKAKLTLVWFFVSQIIYAKDGAVKGKINEIISDWIIPVFIVFIIIALIGGLIANYEAIQDKNGEGTRPKGFTNVGLLVLYVFMAELVIGGVVAILRNINISI